MEGAREQGEEPIELHPFQQISQLIARYSENRNLAIASASNRPPVANSLWHGMLQKELTEKFNASRSANQVHDSTNQNNSSSSSNNLNISNLRGVMRYVAGME